MTSKKKIEPNVSFEERAYLERHEDFPMWISYHVEQVAEKLGSRNTEWLSKEQKAVIAEECRKLDAFCEALCSSSEYGNRAAERKAYDVNPDFYAEAEKIAVEREKVLVREEKRVAREAAKLEAERKKQENEEKLKLVKVALKPEEEKEKEFSFNNKLHLEKGLTKRQKEDLLARDFKRLKISPFGDSGAAYYWVKTSWNESAEHAFFCYLIESELRKIGVQEVKLNTLDEPDVDFTYRNHSYCFEVETGSILRRRQLKYLERRFDELNRDYTEVFILVTSKKLKYNYSKYGTVVTRGTLKKTLKKFISDRRTLAELKK